MMDELPDFPKSNWLTIGGILPEYKYKDVGQKFSEGKIDWSYIHWESLEGLAKRLECGAKKYSRDNWKKVPNAKHEYKNALLRHIFRYLDDGEELEDMEDLFMKGTTHLDAAMCCLMFLKYLERETCRTNRSKQNVPMKRIIEGIKENLEKIKKTDLNV